MADPRGRGFNRGRGKWHRPHRQKRKLKSMNWNEWPSIRQWLADILIEANQSSLIFSRLVHQTPKGKILASSTRRGYLVMKVWMQGLPQISLTLAAWDAQAGKWRAVERVLNKIDAWKAQAEELLE